MTARAAKLARAFGLLAGLSLLAACASGPRVAPDGGPAPRGGVTRASHAAPAPTREDALSDAASLVVLAREQARLGLIDQASQSWDRAIDVLAPYAAQDETIGDRIQQIAVEQDRAQAEAALHEDSLPESDGELAAERAEMLDGPGPALDPEHLGEVDQAARGVQPDWPIQLNDKTVAWLEALSSGRLREWFARSLERSGGYVERFRQIFAEEGVPQDLVYLAHIESAFQSHALSRAQARGMFQFIPGTGRRYGLAIDTWLDERADPEKACRAAASYLRDLYAEFGDWNLALASYNAGEGRVRGAIAQTGSRDFWVLAQRSTLRPETRNYVPAIQAATVIAKDPVRFGFGWVDLQDPVAYEVVPVPFSADMKTLASVAQTDPAALRALNPDLRRGVTPPGRTYMLKVPVGASAGFTERLAQVPPEQRVAQLEHRVRRGETVTSVAKRYRVSASALRAANGLSKNSRLQAGQVLAVPRGSVDVASLADDEPQAARGPSRTHRVRSGETLGSIAGRYGVSVSSLQRWNGMGRSTKLLAGQKLKVSAPGAAVASSGGSRGGSAATSGSASTHRVVPGETASAIARRYGVALDQLLRANGLSAKSTIKVGQRLTVPGRGSAASTAEPASGSAKQAEARVATVHVVRKGETLFRIAQRYGTTVEKICQANDIARDSVLTPGTALNIAK
ncbi:MAG: LysM peptidoglycan-binding domain-containing protein [Acidobacteria bacterium]|jgi:membrane-bound lytic murein transglycosylase D|nr:LysM peptidoglycan-binding domain-containing protein [Acidobacteriota bacterium]